MRENKRKITSLVILLVLLTSAVIGLSGFTQNANGPLGEGPIIASDAPYSETVRNLSSPFFTLTAMTNEGEEDALYARQKALYSLEHDLKQIGIGLDIQLLDWPTFVGQLIAFREFDMCYVGLSGSSKDPDYSGVYDENGSLNLFGYHTSMDYDEFLGTGINEWYIQHGLEIMPPDSQERITHYHEWQNYMMEEILPLVPAYTAQEYMAHWSNLQGFDYTSGLLQSWGKMYWSDIHPGQIATNELVIPAQDDWYDLNPLFSGNNLDELIEYGIMDPLVWYDKDTSAFWPHIVSWEQLSDDQIRLHIRENIPWQLDPEGLFPGEYLDVEDVYFSLYCWKNISGNSYLYDWIADMQIVDQYTLDIIIDPNFIPHHTYLSDLNVAVLPEHYLNQTQDVDGITPDITHMSWNYFATQPFGTGIFQFGSHFPGVETILTLDRNGWRFDPAITSDPELDFYNRFGFDWAIDNLRIRVMPDQYMREEEFYNGWIDMIDQISPEELWKYDYTPDFIIQQRNQDSILFYGFNMRETRGTPMQSMDPCPGDPTITKGLAIRKAIAYATNLAKQNEEQYEGTYEIANHPIKATHGRWLSPDVNKYEYNLEMAKYYMSLAGYDMEFDTDGDGYSDFEEENIYDTDPFDQWSKPLGPFFSIDLLVPNTNPDRVAWAHMIAQELPKIGIHVNIFDETGWEEISPRTWGNAGPYPIGTYAEGGYDAFFIGWGWSKEYNPHYVFDSSMITPNGDNFYQYSNPEMDAAIGNLTESFMYDDTAYWASEIQRILHEDNPGIPIVQYEAVYAHDPELIGWDPNLWYYSYQSMENWELGPGVTELHYASPGWHDIFHPHWDWNQFDNQWLNQIFNGLIKDASADDGYYLEDLAFDYSTFDGLTYTIFLNDQAKWADGTPITSQDIYYSYMLQIESEWGSPNYWYWSQYIDSNSITIFDDQILEITFLQKIPYMESLLRLPILPAHIWSGIPVYDHMMQAMDWAYTDPTKIMGAGPYYLYNFDDINQVIHLKRNEFYDDWTGITPTFEDIYFELYYDKEFALDALAYGMVDIVDKDYYILPDEIPIEASYSKAIDRLTQELSINQEHPYLGTGELCPIPGKESASYVRKAISHIIPRERIVDEILGGVGIPTDSLWPMGANYYDPSFGPTEYNLDLALEYMALAGFDVTIFVDSDGDGITDEDELNIYFTDPNNPDTDFDGLIDYEEIFVYGTDPNNPDTDADSLTDGDEVLVYGTDPLNPDTDNDGISDAFEIDIYFTDPLNPDTDGDTLLDGDEVYKYYTDPLVPDIDLDSDLDGLTNVEEVDIYGTNVFNNDTDADGLTDYDEIFVYFTDPLLEDTDGDGYSDGEEIEEGTDPLDPNDYPRTTIILGFSIIGYIIAIFAGLSLIAMINKKTRK